MNYEEMSVDELDAASASLKDEIGKLRDERIAIKAVRDRKVAEANIRARLSPAEIAALGGIVVTPEPAELGLEGN